MPDDDRTEPIRSDAGAQTRLGVYTLGFARQRQVRRILALAGYPVGVGLPGRFDAIGVWGRRRVSWRGFAAARAAGKPVVTIEDGFLRSLDIGARGEPPLSLCIDDKGIYYDAAAPSALEAMLQETGWEDPALIARASAAMTALRGARLSKYNNAPDDAPDLPDPGYVLVVDQTRGDASIRFGGADETSFERMLQAAIAEHPGKQIVVKTHPDVIAGTKRGHFSPEQVGDAVRLYGHPVNPWTLIERASALYVVTSQLGMEGLIAGKPVTCFGAPFYAGWGATQDRGAPSPRRTRNRSIEEIFAAAYLLYPVYYDPMEDRLCEFERVLEILTTLRRRNEENRQPTIAAGMRLWKRKQVADFLASTASRPRFEDDPEKAATAAAAIGGRVAVWASQETEALRQSCDRRNVPLARVEDGFIRSVGLGAELLPAASLVVDQKGIYFDPSRPSDLEDLLNGPTPDQPMLDRAAALRAALTAWAVTKYNVGEAPPEIDAPPGARILLVPGQVEDDASIRLGAGEIRTNLALLQAARAENPDAYLIYKPHPDVEAGLRTGAIPRETALDHADLVAENTAAAALIDHADEVWTMTSLMGFEALIRGRKAVCFGAPFYAGWGLTDDRMAHPRRTARISLDHLVAAALIMYPRYIDPVTGTPCEVETVLDRIARRAPEAARNSSPALRLLAKAQGLAAGWSWLWR